VKGKYIRSYPLNHYQTTLIDNEEESCIALKVFITFNFMQELLKHTESLKNRYVDLLRKRIENLL